MNQEQKIRVLSSAERQTEALRFVIPNPGDIIMAMAFGWAMFCVLLFAGPQRLIGQVARLARATTVRDAILNIDAGSIVLVIVVGTLLIVSLVVFCYAFRKVTFGLLLFGMSFSNASWKPLHDVAFGLKYLIVMFFACYGGLFLLKNFWRMVAHPYVRWQLAYVAWVALISFALGGQVSDYWYAGTDFALIVGVAAGWWFYVEDTDQMREYCMVIVWVAAIVTLINATAPVLSRDHVEQGRFMAFTNGATNFSTLFAPMLLALFWMAMGEKDDLKRNVFSALALLGLLLLLWTGSRGAVLGMMVSIFVIWKVFKTRIFIYMIALAVLGLSSQIIGGDNQKSFQQLSTRLSGLTENVGRLDLWASQISLAAQSPIYGYSVSGRNRAKLNDSLLKALKAFGLVNSLKTQSTHNSYLAMLVKFGA
ncbi:MAG: O-antigen ligase family protein, partial [Gammaproteobacteria bacterium]